MRFCDASSSRSTLVQLALFTSRLLSPACISAARAAHHCTIHIIDIFVGYSRSAAKSQLRFTISLFFQKSETKLGLLSYLKAAEQSQVISAEGEVWWWW